MRVAWFTAREQSNRWSPSAYVTRSIVPYLREQGLQIDLFSDQVQKQSAVGPHHHYLMAGQMHRDASYDVFFHQVEEGSEAHFLRTAIGLYPGLTYFHDLYLSDLGPDPLTNSPWSFVANLMNDRVPTAQMQWPHRLQEFPRRGPFPEREFALSWAAVYASTRMCADAHSRDSRKPLAVIPYPISFDMHDVSKASVVAVYGSPFIEDRMHKVLPALKKMPNVKVIWGVPAPLWSYAKDRLKEFYADFVEVLPIAHLHEWAEVASSAAVCVHLHHSVYGNCSPFIETSLAAGAHVLMTEGIDDTQFPQDLICPIPAGETESSRIFETIKAIMQTPSLLPHALGQQYVEHNHNPAAIGAEFVKLFEQTQSSFIAKQEWWRSLQVAARAAVFDEIARPQSEGVLSDPFASVYRSLGWAV